MKRHLRRALDRLAPGEGMVLMSHNLHLAKDNSRIEAPGVGPGGGRVESAGAWLNRLLPGQVLSVWMLFERGRDNQPFAGLPQELSSPRGSLNALLGHVGDCFALPTASDDRRAAPLRREAAVDVHPLRGL
jgi:hypothetical protein